MNFDLFFFPFHADQGYLEISYVDHNTSKIYNVETISYNRGIDWSPVKKLVQKLPSVYRVSKNIVHKFWKLKWFWNINEKKNVFG